MPNYTSEQLKTFHRKSFCLIYPGSFEMISIPFLLLNLLSEMRELFYPFEFIFIWRYYKQAGNYILHTDNVACRSQNITSLCHDNEDIRFVGRSSGYCCYFLRCDNEPVVLISLLLGLC